MTATNERTGTLRPSRRRHARRHEDAVIQAEVRRLARALSPYRVLQRDALRPTADFYACREPAPRVLADGSD